MSLFAELKRRNVFRVATSYAIVAWIVLQVADTTFPALNIPAWVMSLLTVLFLLGFPLAIFLAWAYEMTPEGVKPTAEVPVDESIRAQTGRKMNALIAGGLALLVVVLGADFFLRTDVPAASAEGATAQAQAVAVEEAANIPASVPPNSIAVLPFANLSSDPEQDYFSDGLTEELLNQLAQVSGLQVAGRTSSFTFKDSDADPQRIGTTLGVAHILNGSVRKSGNQLRITAQLIKAEDGYQLWSGSFDRELTDVFAIQDEIAESVTTALSITIGAGEFGRPGMTRNIEAYDAYLQALRYWRDYSGPVAVRNAIEQIERAVTLDGSFSQAWLLLADIYGTTSQFLTAEERSGFRERIAEARATVRQQAPDLPELQRVSAQELVAQGRLVEAEQVLLDYLGTAGASNTSAIIDYGNLMALVGRRQEALRYFLLARRLDPLDITASWNLIQAYMALERYDESSAEITRGLALEGLDEFIAGQRMFLEFQRGDANSILAVLEQISSNPMVPFIVPLVEQWRDGDAAGALATIREAAHRPNASGVALTVISQLATLFGDPQLALDLRTGTGEFAGLIGARRDVSALWQPYGSEVRKLPGFKRWLEQLGVVAYWRSTGNWAELCHPVNDDFECE